jgi:hypothetical protein
MRTCNTLIECSSYLTYEDAGGAMDVHNKMNEFEFNYRPMYVSQGIVVQVYRDGKLLGYIAESRL